MLNKRQSKKTSNHFLAVWDCYGLEAIYDVLKAKQEIEDWEKENMFSILKETNATKCPNPIPLHGMLLRARMNTQRSYEIYEFPTTMTLQEVKKCFKNESSAQVIVNWIRENGHKIYSDYTANKHLIR